jgi:BirA family biotin operon repressor/biotin-[acetyl-CoA-carboxylase] ligase
MFDPLPDDLAAALEGAAGTLGPFASVHYVERIGSTNDAALALAASGAQEGASVIAGCQTAGRGRRGDAWHSPAGAGLYVSVLVGPRCDGQPLPLVTIGAGVAAAEAVAAVTGLPIELKWPNDIVIGRPWRKMGGVLTEMATAGGAASPAVVGIGLNLREGARPESIAPLATSIEAEVGHCCDRSPLVVILLARLRELVQLMHADARHVITNRWRHFARASLGVRVRWQDETGRRTGIAEEIDEDGALLVREGGRPTRVMAGTLVWEGLSRE